MRTDDGVYLTIHESNLDDYAAATLAPQADSDGTTFSIELTPLPELPGSDDTFWKIELARRTEFAFCNEALTIRGSPEDQRSRSWGGVQGTWLVLNRYADLYEQYPPEVRGRATARAAIREAKFHLDEHVWSSVAIRRYMQAIRAHPDPPTRMQALGVASILGRPGQEIVRAVGKRVL